MSEECPFRAPLVHVWGGESFRGGLLEDAQLRELGGRTFIVGTVVTNDARNGRTMWMPIEQIVAIVEYPNKARADKVSAEHKEYHDKKTKRGWWGSRS